MERLVRYKVNFESKWITASCSWMGVAFFLQVLDYFGLRMMQGMCAAEAVLMIFLPMLLEAAWCICLRLVKWEKVSLVLSILGAVICLVIAVQCITGSENLFFKILSTALLIFAGAAMVLILWGFVPRRSLGMLIFAVLFVFLLLPMDFMAWLQTKDWVAAIRALPSVLVVLGMLLSFGGVYAERLE